MQQNNAGPLEFFTYDVFSRFEDVSCVVTTRAGGLSEGCYESLNLGLRCGDDPPVVIDNRAQLSLLTGAFPDLPTFGKQVHGNRVAVVTGDLIGSGASDADTAIPDTDAMITDIPDVPLVVLVADCCSVSLYDPVHRAIGTAHAGWRGTVAGIAAATVDKMRGEFGSDPADLLAGIGPSIGVCCYEVGDEVVDRLRDSYPDLVEQLLTTPAGATRPHFDLWNANRLMLSRAGVPDPKIETAGVCTSCRTDLFYSHRAEHGRTGRFGCLIMLHDRTRRVY
jgi:YfiH family protein